MKFKELLDILYVDDNLSVTVGNSFEFLNFAGKKKEYFLRDKKFYDLEVLDLKCVVYDAFDGAEDNQMRITTELQINLLDVDCKVLDPFEE